MGNGFVPQYKGKYCKDWVGVSINDPKDTWAIGQSNYCTTRSYRKAKKVVEQHYQLNKEPEVIWQSETQIQTKRY